MKYYIGLFLGLFLVVLSFDGISKTSMDSLYKVIYSKNYPDTTKTKAAIKLSQKYESLNPDSCIFFGKLGLDLAHKLKDETYEMESLYSIGLGFYTKKEYDSCIYHCERSLQISKSIKDTIYCGNILYKLSRAYSKIGRYDLTIQTQLDAIRFYEERRYNLGIAVMYNNMSIAYKYLGDYRDAIQVLQYAFGVYQKDTLTKNYFTPLLNIGDNYLQLGVYDSALVYLDSSINMVKLYNTDELYLEDYIGYWKGEVSFNNNKYSEALLYFKKSHAVRLEHYDEDDQVYTFLGIGRTLQKLGKNNEALPYLKTALEYAVKTNATKRILMSHEALANLYFETSQFKNSAYHYQQHQLIQKKMFNEEKAMAIMSSRIKFQVEAKDKEIELLNVKNEVAETNERLKDAELKKSRTNQILLFSILSLALIFIVGLFIMIRKRNQTNKLLVSQKEEIEKSHNEISNQKSILETKNREILDSINYAKRIQKAILPPDKLVKDYLKESFVLFKPKDIVAGDFYWLEYKDGKVLFAAADCTGHGVPGAMVSVICNNGLNRAVREYNLSNPGEILDKTREIVIQEFEKSDEDVKDGMDIALCAIEKNAIHYAGANNPLWIIRDGKIIEIKPDKQPIGKYSELKSFTATKIELKKGDCVYVFTDGYADQFGGERGKKFKYKQLQELILSIVNEPMENQKLHLEEAFDKWKGNLEQVDDVCVIGVRI